METIESVEKRVEMKVHRILLDNKDLRTQNERLNQMQRMLEKKLEDTQKELADCREKLRNMTYAKATQVSEDEAKGMRNRMLKMEREIEKCISLLNE